MKIVTIIVLSLFVTVTALTVTGCNTARGVGKDMENAGESIQDSSH